MKREQRISGYRHSLEGGERERAARAQAADHRLREAEARLEELERYRREYLAGFGRRVADGMGGPALRDYHAFLGRLDAAIEQQRQVITRCAAEREFDQQRWREVAVQLKAVSAVIDRWRVEERVVEDRAEQRDIDERAIRMRYAAAAEA
ncbi:MAG: flagellar export protein FliJ [Gammaproteobacteria bacterium]|nr:flagellar export protein FliJ [Gammaproteobacteria bacterium]